MEEIPRKGKGVILKRGLKKGERILSEYPVLLVRFDFLLSKNVEVEVRKRMLEEAVEGLPEETRRAVEGLARGGKRREDEWMADVIRTNGYGGIEVEGVSHIGLFLEGSRVNHGCRPK